MVRHSSLLLILIVIGYTAGNRTWAQDTRPPRTSNKPAPSGNEPKSRLDILFQQYCDYTGSLGIGFVASHTYEYKFRQRLKSTTDSELKRLFVLRHLYRDVDFLIGDYERGQIRVGKVEYRKMTAEEKEKSRKELSAMLDDLKALDPDDPEGDIADYRSKLK